MDTKTSLASPFVMSFKPDDRLFFTSDTHFGHSNIIKFCSRPFKDVHEMNEVMVRNWNEVVKPGDTVFHLGDFAFGGSQLWSNMLDKLNGDIHLVLGNHDMKNLRQGYMSRFKSVSHQQVLRVGDRFVYLNHYPFLCYGGTYRNPKQVVYQLFGHVHSRPNEIPEDIPDEEVKEILGKDVTRLGALFPTQYDVGVDNNNFTPVTFKEIDEKIQMRLTTT